MKFLLFSLHFNIRSISVYTYTFEDQIVFDNVRKTTAWATTDPAVLAYALSSDILRDYVRAPENTRCIGPVTPVNGECSFPISDDMKPEKMVYLILANAQDKNSKYLCVALKIRKFSIYTVY